MDTRADPTGREDAELGSPSPGPGARRRVLRPWVLVAVAAGVAGVGVFVALWFQPQRLFIDERVDQAVPVAEATEPTDPSPPPGAPADDAAQPGAPTTATTAPPPPPEPVELATGTFVSRDHGTSGTVRVLELADGRRFVRLEGFETDNGPDVYVYLSTNPASGPEGAFDDEVVDLGRMQGNIGDQNYELPRDVDPAAYTSVVIWCDRFDSAFGAADLVAPAG